MAQRVGNIPRSRSREPVLSLLLASWIRPACHSFPPQLRFQVESAEDRIVPIRFTLFGIFHESTNPPRVRPFPNPV